MKQLLTGSENRLFSAIRIPKKFWFALGLALLMTLLCSTALACRNPNGECTGKAYTYRYTDDQWHQAECQSCGFTYFAYHEIVQSATCQQPAKCGKCNSSFGGLGTHLLRSYQAREVTCIDKGWDAYNKCAYCDYSTKPYREMNALGHDFVEYEGQAPTCTEEGWHPYKVCTRGDLNTYWPIAPLNHDLVQHEGLDATCTAAGWNAYEDCTRCDYTTFSEAPALGHDFVEYEGKDPTCTEKGWHPYKVCTRGDLNTYWPIAPLNHDLVQHEGLDATCIDAGWNAYEDCTRCDYTTFSEAPALGHEYVSQTFAPTCTADGYTVSTCARCSESFTVNEGEKLGHWFGEWQPDGNRHRADCLRSGCGYTSHTDCNLMDCRLPGKEATVVFQLCPVCGKGSGGAQLALVENSSVAVMTGRLPAGEAVVRMGEGADGTLLLSVAFETAGRLSQANGQMKITLPAESFQNYGFALLNAEGAETPLPVQEKNGQISFLLDFTEPVCLLRLTEKAA